MIFESKKDKLFSTLFYSVLAVLLAVMMIVFSKDSMPYKWLVVSITLLSLFILIWIWYGTSYKVENNILNVVLGPFKQNIPVRTIKKIKIGKTMWLGNKSGLSKGGLILTYNQYDDIYITPNNVDKFCKALKSIHAEIVIEKNID